MKTNSAGPASPSKDLLADLHALVAEAEKMMTDEPGTGPSEGALSALQDRFAAAQECLGELCAGARKKVVAGVKYTDETIRANPYPSLAIAAGVGLLVGVLVSRRTK